MLAHARDYSSNVTKYFLDASGIFEFFLLPHVRHSRAFFLPLLDIDDKLQLSPLLEGFSYILLFSYASFRIRVSLFLLN